MKAPTVNIHFKARTHFFVHILFLRSFPSVLMSWLCHSGLSSDSVSLATHMLYFLMWQVKEIIGRPSEPGWGGGWEGRGNLSLLNGDNGQTSSATCC